MFRNWAGGGGGQVPRVLARLRDQNLSALPAKLVVGDLLSQRQGGPLALVGKSLNQ